MISLHGSFGLGKAFFGTSGKSLFPILQKKGKVLNRENKGNHLLFYLKVSGVQNSLQQTAQQLFKL